MYVVRDLVTGDRWTVSSYQRAEDKKNELAFVYAGPNRLVIEPIPGPEIEDIIAQLQDQLVDEQAAPGDYEGLAAMLDQFAQGAGPSTILMRDAAILRAIAADERRHYEQVQAILLDVQREL